MDLLRRPAAITLLTSIALFLAAALIFGLYGFRGTLVHDDAIDAYAGQQLARGVPPYTSVFLGKGPVPPFIAGFGVFCADLVGVNQLQGIRLAFFVICCVTVSAIYLMASSLFRSWQTGVLAALVFVGFWGFGRHAGSGPRPKSPIVLFETLVLFFAINRKWFWAGFFGSLGFLTWQPMLAYPLATAVLAFIQSDDGQRARSVFKTILGFLVPLALVVAYFSLSGSLRDFLDGFILLHVEHFDRGTSSFISHIASPIVAVHDGYSAMMVPIFISGWALLILCLKRIESARGLWAFVAKDRFAVIPLSLLAPLSWSLLDFQHYPDFYVFLPYSAIGFAWFLQAGLDSVVHSSRLLANAKPAAFLLLCAILSGSAAVDYQQTASDGLVEQRRFARRFGELAGPDFRAVTIGVPEILVLLEQQSYSRHQMIYDGLDFWIEKNEPGGFQGWAESIKEYAPRAVAISWWRFESSTALGDRGHEIRDDLSHWLETNYRRVESLPGWSVWAR